MLAGVHGAGGAGAEDLGDALAGVAAANNARPRRVATTARRQPTWTVVRETERMRRASPQPPRTLTARSMAGVLSRASSEEIRTVAQLSLASCVRREKALLEGNTNDRRTVSVVQRTGCARSCDLGLDARDRTTKPQVGGR